MRYSTAVPLGRGGGSEVFEAWDPVLERKIALKLLDRDDPAALEGMLREARAQARVDHPNVGKVFEVGTSESGQPYIAMQLVDGKPLTEALAARRVETVVGVMKTVAHAVQAAHAAGLIHRDLKPANILVEEEADGSLVPYVLDFGIAREHHVPGVTQTGQLVGTPGYLSPEQASGESRTLDRRSDVFSLGILLYELLGGRRPFRDGSLAEIVTSLLRDDVVPLRKVDSNVPVDLETIVMKCLESEPRRRYDSAAALASDLGRWLDGEPIEARSPTLTYLWLKRARRHPGASAAVLVAMLALLVAGLVSFEARRRGAQQARLAERFGRVAEQLDTSLRLAYMLPVHDVRQDLAEVEAALDALRLEVESVGRLAVGPGNLALGRGFMRLGEWGRARQRLETAWDRGYRTPEVALALGRTLGAEHAARLAELDLMADDEVRDYERDKADRELAAAAQAFLERARSEHPPEENHEALWLDGLLALNRGELERAAARGQEAATAQAWFYEGDLLAAEARLRASSNHRLASRWQAADEALAGALASLQKAATTAPSDPAIRVAQCRARALEIAIARESGREATGRYLALREDCGLARRVDPSRLPLLIAEASGADQWAADLVERGENPTPVLEHSETVARLALEAAPSNPHALVLLGSAAWSRARHRYDQNGDPRDDSEAAIGHYRRALAQAPGDHGIRLELASILTRVGQWESFAARDPMPRWRQATEIYQTAETDDGPLTARLETGRCDLSTEIGYHLFLENGDPGPYLGDAISACNRAVRLSPESLRAWGRLGYAQWSHAEVDAALGRDPTASFVAAADAYERVLRVEPDNMASRVNLSHLLEEHAAWVQGRGADPSSLLEQAERHTAVFREIFSGDFHLIQGKIELVRALAADDPGADAWATAMRHGTALVDLQPSSMSGFDLVAEIARRRTERLIGGGRSAVLSETVEAGLEAASRLLEMDEGNASALGHRAVLLLGKAGLAIDESMREAALRAAHEAAREAIRRRPDLEASLSVVLERVTDPQ